jgi:truncated hemoglobin YjbI
MDKKTSLKKLSEKLGRDRAIETVMNAYNTELIASWLRHLEASQNGKVVRSERRDHLANAIARVAEVCELTD